MALESERYNGPVILKTLLTQEPKLSETVRYHRVCEWINRNLASPNNAEILATMMETEQGQKDLIKAWFRYEAMPDSI